MGGGGGQNCPQELKAPKSAEFPATKNGQTPECEPNRPFQKRNPPFFPFPMPFPFQKTLSLSPRLLSPPPNPFPRLCGSLAHDSGGGEKLLSLRAPRCLTMYPRDLKSARGLNISPPLPPPVPPQFPERMEKKSRLDQGSQWSDRGKSLPRGKNNPTIASRQK